MKGPGRIKILSLAVPDKENHDLMDEEDWIFTAAETISGK